MRATPSKPTRSPAVGEIADRAALEILRDGSKFIEDSRSGLKLYRRVRSQRGTSYSLVQTILLYDVPIYRVATIHRVTDRYHDANNDRLKIDCHFLL